MDEKKVLEEHLREASCVGDTDAVQELINLGVDVNSKHAINGWTALHWACKRNYVDLVVLLLKNGADKNIVTEKGETPASVCSNPHILKLLDAKHDFTNVHNEQKHLDFVPNYIKNPVLPSKLSSTFYKDNEKLKQETFQINQEELILKIRIAHASDPDFIEVDIPRHCLTYGELIKVCCDELNVSPSQIVKLRKLPNTRIRRDKDVTRLQNYQEIEVVIYSSLNINNETVPKQIQCSNGNATPITPTNNYQSISKKDQTILY